MVDSSSQQAMGHEGTRSDRPLHPATSMPLVSCPSNNRPSVALACWKENETQSDASTSASNARDIRSPDLGKFDPQEIAVSPCPVWRGFGARLSKEQQENHIALGWSCRNDTFLECRAPPRTRCLYEIDIRFWRNSKSINAARAIRHTV